jgi:hypothetical protein
MNKKGCAVKYSLYESSISCVLPTLLLLLCLLSIVLSGFFIKKFLFDSYDPAVYFLVALMIGPWIYVIIGLQQSGLFKRLFLRFSVDESGIHCFLFGKKQYEIGWDHIHTFGIIGFSFSYVNGVMILYSTDEKEYAPKNFTEINRISNEKLVIQYRADVWDALRQFMPFDMCEKLSYAVSRNQDCFHKR